MQSLCYLSLPQLCLGTLYHLSVTVGDPLTDLKQPKTSPKLTDFPFSTSSVNFKPSYSLCCHLTQCEAISKKVWKEFFLFHKLVQIPSFQLFWSKSYIPMKMVSELVNFFFLSHLQWFILSCHLRGSLMASKARPCVPEKLRLNILLWDIFAMGKLRCCMEDGQRHI